MDNPYSVNELTPALADEERKRPKFSRALFTAYAVHHVASVLGMLTGVLIKPSEWQNFFPLHDPVTLLMNLFLIPAIDLFIVVEPPLMSVFAPQLFTFWHWLRIPLTLSIPAAGFMYAFSRRRDWLWVVGIVSFGVFLSFVLWYSMDPRSM